MWWLWQSYPKERRTLILLLLLILNIKHFIYDFLWQPPFMWQNKGTYGHIGGILHAAMHSIVTGAILAGFGFAAWPVYGIMILEFVIHYHMDWFKMWYNKRKGWGATTHPEFWVLTGFDQLIHALTYLLIAALLF
jgi:hypothetical protein